MDTTQLEGRLASIEKRLTEIEGNFKKSSPPSVSQSAPQAASYDVWNDPLPATLARQENIKPGNWLGGIAVLCFVLAAAFIIKLSIESGWLTHTRQIGLAAVLGLSLVGAGLALIKSDREYAGYLPGAGIIVLFLTAFASHRYYDLVSFDAALGLTATVSALCIGLYLKIRHDVYPITAALGAYLAPVILGLNADGIFSAYYFLLCSTAFATISIGVESRVLQSVSAYLAIIMTAMVGLNLGQNALIAIMLGLNFLVFSVGAYLYSHQTGKALRENEAWCYLPVALIFYAVEYYYIDLIHPGLAPWISLGFSGFLTGLYLLAKQQFPAATGSRSLIAAFVAIVCFHSVYLELLPDQIKPWLFVVITLLAVELSAKATNNKNDTAFTIPVLTLLVIAVIEYVSIVWNLWETDAKSWALVGCAGVISLWITIVRSDDKLMKQDMFGHGLLTAAHILAIFALYRVTTDIGSLAVSASWLLYAVGVLVFSFARKDNIMARSALFVLSFAAGKALLYDAASAATVVRILCLLLTGAVLYGCGYFMREAAQWDPKD